MKEVCFTFRLLCSLFLAVLYYKAVFCSVILNGKLREHTSDLLPCSFLFSILCMFSYEKEQMNNTKSEVCRFLFVYKALLE